MKIAYLILAHKDPDQVLALVKKLSTDQVHCFVHYDTHSSAPDFIDNSYVNFFRVFNTPWGSFETIKAELLLLYEALSWGADRFVMLSGQDYPIKDNAYIDNYFAENKNIGFVQAIKLPDTNWTEHQGGMYRVNRFHCLIGRKWRAFPMHTKKEPFRSIFNMLANALHHLFLQTKKIPYYYNGSHWWSLNRAQVEYILKMAQNKLIVRAFKYSRNSDELFIHSILNNAPSNKFNLKSVSLHYIKGLQNSAHPDILDETDFEKIKASSFLFARKMEQVKSKKLIQLLN